MCETVIYITRHV